MSRVNLQKEIYFKKKLDYFFLCFLFEKKMSSKNHPMELPNDSSLEHVMDSPPISPMSKDFTLMPETTDVDRTRNKYGDKSVVIRRQSSTDWETPFGREGHHFAKVKNDDDHFEAKLDLNAFPGPQYKMNEIDVRFY
uniref:Uncharacterized protein n=1 Tax=Panagrolaimus sp. JU765 TaxID=591449 RepID=A0AC34RHT5_9BILA